MIVVVIIGILAAIALPAYQEQQRKARRGAAEAHLMEIASKEQAYLLDTRAGYTNALATLNLTTPSDVSSKYTVSITTTAGPPPTFTVTAAPGTSQSADLGGLSLTITNLGVKGPCIDNSSGAYTNAPCATGTTSAW